MKKLFSLLLVAVMLLSLAGCFSTSVVDADEAVFTKAGMEITLTEGFTETEMEGFTACYDSTEVAVFVLKEDFSSVTGFADLSLADYADLVHQANSSKSPDAITEVDGLTTMEYDFYNEEEGNNYRYFATMFKGSDAFWLIQFASLDADYEEYKPYFIEWAKTAKFTEAE